MTKISSNDEFESFFNVSIDKDNDESFGFLKNGLNKLKNLSETVSYQNSNTKECLNNIKFDMSQELASNMPSVPQSEDYKKLNRLWESVNACKRFASEFYIPSHQPSQIELNKASSDNFKYTGKLNLISNNRIDNRAYTVTAISSQDYEHDYINELHAMSALRDSNPYIVKYFSAWRENGLMFIQTELQNDTLLTKHSRNLINNKELIKIISNVTAGIEYLHSKGICNLDINTSSIFLSETGFYKLNCFKNCIKSNDILDEEINNYKCNDYRKFAKTVLELILKREISSGLDDLIHVYNENYTILKSQYDCMELVHNLIQKQVSHLKNSQKSL